MTPADLKVAHHFVSLPNLRLHYVERGTGPVVVLLHGFPETWWSWRHQIEAIANAGFRVIAPDLRGFGESGTNGPFDLDTITADVGALIESLGVDKRVKIVGHDWGGATAWHLAAHRPEFVERVAVLNCPHPALLRTAILRNWKQLRRSWYMFFFQLPWLPEWALSRNDGGEVVRMLRGVSIDRTNFGEDDVQPFREAIARPGVASSMLGWYRAAIRAGFSKQKPWPLITAQTLLIWGMSDPALGFDDVVPGTEAHAPHLKIERIPNAGHFVQSERPEAVNPLLIDFLSRPL
jgi:pimeloyl-ACP methyl ester carboxylesterase